MIIPNDASFARRQENRRYVEPPRVARARETREAREAQKTGATGGRRAPAPLPVHRTAQRSSYEGWYGRWDRWKGRTHENKAFSLPKDNNSSGGGGDDDDDDDDKLNSKESNVYVMYIYIYICINAVYTDG